MMMEFVGRRDEQQRLRKALEAEERKFVAVCGRRRLVKSTLVRRVLHDDDVHFETGKDERAIHIALPARAMGATYGGFDAPLYPSWESVLVAFNGICKDSSTLVLDEFPYMVEKDAAISLPVALAVSLGKKRQLV